MPAFDDTLGFTISAPLAAGAALAAERVRRFNEQGFLTLVDLVGAADLEQLQAVLPDLFAARAGRAEGAHYDLVTDDAETGRHLLPTIINPQNYAASLRGLELQRNCLELARQLLGPDAAPSFQHAILKPPFEGSETPWHQDDAYRSDVHFAYNSLSIWIPLQQVTVENGCMVYLPQSHRRGLLQHRSLHDDSRIAGLECAAEFGRHTAVACPLPAGGATVHHCRTLHYAAPNRTDSARYAYILVFETTPQPLREPRDLRWLRERRSRAFVDRHRWRRRGGMLIEAVRLLRDGTWRNPRRLLFEARRGWHWLVAWLTGKV